MEQKASYNFLETFSKWPFRQRIMQHIMLKAYTVDHMLILGVGLNVNNTQAQTLQFMVECFFLFVSLFCSISEWEAVNTLNQKREFQAEMQECEDVC